MPDAPAIAGIPICEAVVDDRAPAHPAPAAGILAFYDGRVDGYRFAAEPNWVDDGALSLGIASYALVEGDEALIYDTHVSVAARALHPRQAGG